jgi:hypothetical protein
MNTEEIFIKRSHKLINKLILKSREFCNLHCVPDALTDILAVFYATKNIPNNFLFSNKLSYDYDYFAFTKSTKSLIAAKCLLNDKNNYFNEECFMIIRSIFECHIMSRYVREHIDITVEKNDVIRKFIVNPLSVTFNYYTLQGSTVKDDKDDKVGIIPMPNRFLIDKDKLYYSEFYQFLCQYTHCSFGALICYYGDELFTYNKNNYSLLTLLFIIFVFTKIYEGVVTVVGEDLGDKISEKSYYKLAYDSLDLQIELFNYLIDYYTIAPQDKINIILEKYLGDGSYDNVNSKIVSMLSKMNNSLNDIIGSLDKSTINKSGYFERIYPEYK